MGARPRQGMSKRISPSGQSINKPWLVNKLEQMRVQHSGPAESTASKRLPPSPAKATHIQCKQQVAAGGQASAGGPLRAHHT